VPRRADVADLQHHLARNLLLEIQVVILHVGRADVAVHRENVSGGGCPRSGEHRNARRDRPAHCADRENGRRAERIVSWARVEAAVIGQVSQEEVLREGVVENAEAGANYRLAFAEGIPGQAEARSEVVVVRLVKAAEPGRPYLRQGDRGCGRVKPGNIAKQVVLFLDDTEVVPP